MEQIVPSAQQAAVRRPVSFWHAVRKLRPTVAIVLGPAGDRSTRPAQRLAAGPGRHLNTECPSVTIGNESTHSRSCVSARPDRIRSMTRLIAPETCLAPCLATPLRLYRASLPNGFGGAVTTSLGGVSLSLSASGLLRHEVRADVQWSGGFVSYRSVGPARSSNRPVARREHVLLRRILGPVRGALRGPLESTRACRSVEPR